MAFLQGSGTVVLGSMSSGGTATIAAGTFYHVTSATQTITLPASPNSGDLVGISVGNFSDTVVARNGTNIMRLAENMTIDVPNVSIELQYTGNTTIGWVVL